MQTMLVLSLEDIVVIKPEDHAFHASASQHMLDRLNRPGWVRTGAIKRLHPVLSYTI